MISAHQRESPIEPFRIDGVCVTRKMWEVYMPRQVTAAGARMSIESEYLKIISLFDSRKDVKSGQMFGKSCLKVNGKAFIAQHRDVIVFKLAGLDHEKALATAGAHLWDPGGKGRPMKEWVALPIEANSIFQYLAESALIYVQS